MKFRQSYDFYNILISGSFLIFTVLLLSCNQGSKTNVHSSETSSDSINNAEKQNSSHDSVVNFLLDVAVKDFQEHQPPVPLAFRNVQFKYLTKPNEGNVYLICGEFLNQDKRNTEEWINFTTIKTDPYEQWMGSNALQYCREAKEIPYTKIDLSIALKSKFDSLQKLTK